MPCRRREALPQPWVCRWDPSSPRTWGWFPQSQQEPSPLHPMPIPQPRAPKLLQAPGQQALASFSPRTPRSPQFLSARVPRVGREASPRPGRRGAKRWDARKGGEMKKRRLLFTFISFLYFFVFFFFKITEEQSIHTCKETETR